MIPVVVGNTKPASRIPQIPYHSALPHRSKPFWWAITKLDVPTTRPVVISAVHGVLGIGKKKIIVSSTLLLYLNMRRPSN